MTKRKFIMPIDKQTLQAQVSAYGMIPSKSSQKLIYKDEDFLIFMSNVKAPIRVKTDDLRLSQETFSSNLVDASTLEPIDLELTDITDVKLPMSLTSVNPTAFDILTSLSSLSFPASTYVAEIEDGTFQNCSNLQVLNLGNGLTSIGENAFKDASSLEQLGIPYSLKQVADTAFANVVPKHLDFNLVNPSFMDRNIQYGSFLSSQIQMMENQNVMRDLSSFFSRIVYKYMTYEDLKSLRNSSNLLGTAIDDYIANDSFSKYITIGMTVENDDDEEVVELRMGHMVRINIKIELPLSFTAHVPGRYADPENPYDKDVPCEDKKFNTTTVSYSDSTSVFLMDEDEFGRVTDYDPLSPSNLPDVLDAIDKKLQHMEKHLQKLLLKEQRDHNNIGLPCDFCGRQPSYLLDLLPM